MTLQLLPHAFKHYLGLLGSALCAPVSGRQRISGAIRLMLLAPLFLLWQLLHWLGFVLDEIFFRGYRRVNVTSPLFVIGPPRSGTTHLHHALALDDRMTTFRTWECLLGLSVTGRKLCLFVAAIDRRIGRHGSRLLGFAGKRLASSLEDIHPLRLNEPEEDFLCLMPSASCFLLTVAFPGSDWLWKLARADTELSCAERRRLTGYYRACIQKHLYVFGREKRFLSKNASFGGMAEALRHEFPDARFFMTTRDPLETLPSQLSSLKPALTWFGYSAADPEFRERFASLLLHYYEHLADFADRHPADTAVLYMDALRDDLAASIERAMRIVGIEPEPAFAARLRKADRNARRYRSRHRYTLDEFALSQEAVRERFESVYSRYQFT